MALSGTGILENIITSLQKCDGVLEKVTRRLEDLENAVAGLHANRQEGCDFATLLETLKTATSAFTKLSTQIAFNPHAVTYAPSVATDVDDPVYEVATTTDQPKSPPVENPAAFIPENEDDEENYLDYTDVSSSPDVEELPPPPPTSDVSQRMSQPPTEAFVNEVKAKNPSIHDSTLEAEIEKKPEKPFVDDSTPEVEMKSAFEDEASVDGSVMNAPRKRFYSKSKSPRANDLDSSIPEPVVKTDENVIFKAKCKLYNVVGGNAIERGTAPMMVIVNPANNAGRGLMCKADGSPLINFLIKKNMKATQKESHVKCSVFDCIDYSTGVAKDGTFIARFADVGHQEKFTELLKKLQD